MPRNPKARQRSLQRHAAKRKQKRQALAASHPSGARSVLRAAASWPLDECLVTQDWQKHPDELVQILVARRSPEGTVAAATILVDLACLGVKNAMGSLLTPQEYRELREGMASTQRLMPADLDLVAKIAREGIAYARQLGFHPHRDYQDAAVLLAGADPDACDLDVPLGVDGKPLFVAGPYDDAPRIVAQLTRAVGPDGFDFVVPVDEDELLTLLEDELEEEPDWDSVRPPPSPGPAWLDWWRRWRSKG
jgi:hypothetical protein